MGLIEIVRKGANGWGSVGVVGWSGISGYLGNGWSSISDWSSGDLWEFETVLSNLFSAIIY